MKIIDRLFVRLLTRLTLSRATRQGDLAADLAAAHGTDLANTLADIDRLRRLLDIRIERVRAFVDDYSVEVNSLAQAEHMAMSLEAAADEWMEIQHDGANALVDYRDHDIADLKRQLTEANKSIGLLHDNNTKYANSMAANAEELERFHVWALKLSGLQEKGNPSHATVREQVSKNFEQLTAAHNELVLKLAKKTEEIEQWRAGSEKLQGQMVEIDDRLRGSEAENKNLRGLLSKAERIRDRLQAQARDFGADETQQTICKCAFETFGECTPERAAGRLVEEMMELLEELGLRGLVVETGDHWREASRIPYERQPLIKELADVVICGYRVADLCGYDLHREIDRVMQINRGRQWVRDGKGCGYHVKPLSTKLPSLTARVSIGDIAPPPSNFGGDYFEIKPGTLVMQPGEASGEIGYVVNASDTVPLREQTQPGTPAFFDDETETLPASELATLKRRLDNAERWESLLRDSLERVLRAMFGAEVAARAIGDIGTDSFEGTMQAVREKVEYAKAWCDEGGGSEIATARLKDRAEAMLLREKSVRAELRSIADRIRTGFAGGAHAAADAIERALADLP